MQPLTQNTDIMNTMTPDNITRMIDAMSVDELRMRLAAYMMAELQKASQPVAIEVRLSDTLNRGGRYDVFFVMENGEEVEVKFTDRYSRLIYIYTLLHPKGFQRRSLEANNYKQLCNLYRKLYFTSSEPLLKSIDRYGFDQFFCQAVAQSRVAVRNAISASDDVEIARPQRHNGKTIVIFAANGGTVIVDNSLL